MSTSQITEQLYKLQQQKRAAEQAEQERIDREEAARRQIAETEAEIERLKVAQRESLFQDDLRLHQQLQQMNAATIPDFLSALDEIGMSLGGVLGAEFAAVMRTFEDQMNHRKAALANYDQSIPFDREYPVDTLNMVRPKEVQLQQSTALPPWAVLVQWIMQSPDDTTRRIRQGLTYALVGRLYEPSPNYDPVNDLNTATKIYVRRW